MTQAKEQLPLLTATPRYCWKAQLCSGHCLPLMPPWLPTVQERAPGAQVASLCSHHTGHASHRTATSAQATPGMPRSYPSF